MAQDLDDRDRTSVRLALREIRGPMETRSSGASMRANVLVPDSMLTPSPDELIIRQRGRRQSLAPSSELQCQQFLSLLQSPVKARTPTKNQQSPKKSGGNSVRTRCSPRKRLYMPDSPTSPLNSPTKARQARVNCQLIKRQRTQRRAYPPEELNLALKGLSQVQLADIITMIVHNNPQMKEEIKALIPLPDLSPLEDRLVVLRRHISAAFPRTRLVSRGDAFCYHRVLTHLNTFKSECLEQSRCLLHCKQWSSVVDYVLLAWSYVDRLPNWDCPSHNKVKQNCFSTLASHCMTALKAGNFELEHLREIAERLKEAEACSIDIGPCFSYVNNLTRKFVPEAGIQDDLVVV